MLNEQDLVRIEDVVDRKTSDLRHNVSNLQQDMSIVKEDVSVLKQKVSNIEHEIKEMREENNQKFDNLGRQMYVLHEDTKNEFKLLIENMGGMIKEALTPVKEKVFENHETRISTLEMVVKKKLA